MKSIRELFMDSNSDKQSVHRYGFFYDMLLNYVMARKSGELNLLEIGVSRYKGGSFSVWTEAGHVSRVVGLDANESPDQDEDGTVFYQLDPYDKETVGHLVEIEGAKFDVIIHDGAMDKEKQAFFLDNYTDLLSEYGYLVCEDVLSTELVMEQCKSDTVFVIDGWANRGVNVRGFNDPNFYNHAERLIIKSRTEPIKEGKKHETKPHIARLPVKPFDCNYERNSTELAVSIPLFHSELDTQYEDFDEERFREVHCKGALWAGMSFLKNTDLAERGTPLFFHIEDKVWDITMTVFEDYGIPESWCRKMTTPLPKKEPELKVNKTHFGKTYLGLLDDTIDPDVLLILDSDFFTCTEEHKFKIYDKLTSTLLKTQPSMTYFQMKELPYYWYVSLFLLASGLPDLLIGKRPIAELEQEAFQRLGFEKEVDLSVKESDKVQRFFCENYMMTFPRNHETRDFAIKNIPTCHTAPYLFGMWGEFNHPFIELAPLLKIPVYDWESQYIEAKKGDNCFAHFRVDKPEHRSLSNPTRIHEYWERFYSNIARHVV